MFFRQEGVLGFYKGITMNAVKGPIAIGISFTSYEISKMSIYKIIRNSKKENSENK